MTAGFENKTAVVTGCTSGIGRATVQALLEAGAHVVGVGRDEQRLAGMQTELGDRFSSITADLSSRESIERAGAKLAIRRAKLDLFVSNAAECSYDGLLEIDPEAALRLFQVNVVALATFARALVPLLSGGGQIIQLSSVTARFLPGPKFAAYAATKRAVETYAEALRLELAPAGIRVGLIAPGLVDTPIYDKVRGFESARRKLETQIPEWLSPDDIAQAVLFIASRPPHVAISDLVLYPAAQTR